MSLLAWNCQGIRGELTVRALRLLVQKHRPSIIFLSETKSNSRHCNKIAQRCNLVGIFTIDSSNATGGLCLLWNSELQVTIHKSSPFYIHATIEHPVLPASWILTTVYGPPYSHAKPVFWAELTDIANTIDKPWLIVGDFNEICYASDKIGGRNFTSSFRSFLDTFLSQSGCIDLGFTGNPFTWRNKRMGLAFIRQRLDRALANDDWRTTFPRAGVFHLPQIRSNHNPILLKLWTESANKPKPFRFEEAWTRDHSSTTIVKNAWNKFVPGSKAFQLSSKIKIVKTGLRKWNKDVFGFCDTNIEGIMKKIEEIQTNQTTLETKEEEENLMAELEENLLRKDLIWRQKSRELWLKHGDRNSKFFHLSTVIRRRSNHIATIKGDNGEWCQYQDEIGNYFLKNFQDLFTTSQPTIPDDMEGLINQTITEA
ncbi:uncharacterized protein LOC116203481 [Punica granatum]|uniref:Uncharacterized protein LOC116203481 n=1 Tax=Punica granatum TaxID=22663 RepID=A0A6P8DHY3_PUNGR|nr:uncharacterized protein LOC116203481 [Punica granatum]